MKPLLRHLRLLGVKTARLPEERAFSAAMPTTRPLRSAALKFGRLLAAMLLGLACLPAPTRATATSRVISAETKPQAPQLLTAWRTDNDGAPPAAARLPGAWATLAGAGAGRKQLEIKYPAPGLDLSGYAEVAVPVRNTGAKPLRLLLRVLTPDSGGKTESPRTGRTHEAVVRPTATPVWLFVTLAGDEAAPYFRKFIAFRQAPADFVRPGVLPDDHIAPGPPKGAEITGVVVGLADPEEAGSVEVGPAVARGTPVPLRELPEEKAFPLFDAFGQYAHRDWPGKIHTAADLASAEQQEELDLLANPWPVDWNEFGGWTSGPQLTATGYFRTEKIDGQWCWSTLPAVCSGRTVLSGSEPASGLGASIMAPPSSTGSTSFSSRRAIRIWDASMAVNRPRPVSIIQNTPIIRFTIFSRPISSGNMAPTGHRVTRKKPNAVWRAGA